MKKIHKVRSKEVRGCGDGAAAAGPGAAARVKCEL